jgi:Protein of unknown function (DUF3891)
MIRKAYREGWLLIPQPAHAWVSGLMAQKWGNKNINQARPYQAVVLGTMLHDAGWLAVDEKSPLNEKGEPLHFLEAEFDLAEALYRRSVFHVMQIDPYAGLLVGRHNQLIYNSRARHGRDPIEKIQPLLEQLGQQEAQTLEELRNHPIYCDYLDENSLNHNYRILRTCDLLSLFLFGGFPENDISDVPLRYGEPFETVSCRRIDEETLQIQPNIFAEPELNFTVSAFYIPQKTFKNEAELQKLFWDSERIILRRRIVSQA